MTWRVQGGTHHEASEHRLRLRTPRSAPQVDKLEDLRPIRCAAAPNYRAYDRASSQGTARAALGRTVSEDEVLELDVAVGDAVGMHVTDGEYYLWRARPVYTRRRDGDITCWAHRLGQPPKAAAKGSRGRLCSEGVKTRGQGNGCNARHGQCGTGRSINNRGQGGHDERSRVELGSNAIDQPAQRASAHSPRQEAGAR